MAVRDIVVIEHPVLRRKAKKIVKLTAEHRKLIEDMIETMRDAPGVGLAAPQVGVSERLIVVEYAEDDDEEDAPPKKKKLYVVINPEIVAASEEMETGHRRVSQRARLGGRRDAPRSDRGARPEPQWREDQDRG